MCRRFSRVLVDVGAGGSAAAACKRELSPALTKGMVHAFMTYEASDPKPGLGFGREDAVNPLYALRSAQASGLGGSPAMSRSAYSSILGKTLGDKEEETFAQKALEFCITREEELSNVDTSAFLNYLMATYRTSLTEGETFSLKGRTVNSLLKSAVDVGELFSPSGLGSFTTTLEGEDGAPARIAEVTEIRSAAELNFVGNRMQNCLSTGRGMSKYCHRARGRTSSFWVVSFREAEKEKKKGLLSALMANNEDPRRYALIFEVWNTSRIIHQAEGPGSSFPSEEALKMMEQWAESQEVSWQTWEMW